MNATTILIADDNQSDLFLLQGYLEEWGYAPLSADNGAEAFHLFNSHDVDLIVSDQEMDDMDGIELLKHVKQKNPAIPFIMVTAHQDVAKAVDAMKHGADDYLSKDEYTPDELQAKIARLLGYRIFQGHQQQKPEAFQHIITRSPKMETVFSFALKVAKNPKTTVLIEGESGTGKGLLARAIHEASAEAGNPFVHVNCAAIPPELLESELFGYVKGAFTGADRNKEGKFDAACGGTLLLDEIGEMRLDLQTKLLRALQEKTYEPIGSNKKRQVDCRMICATNQKLLALLNQGRFREDLYYRINVFPLTIPPLKDRKEDIPLLANHFLERFQQENQKAFAVLSDEALKLLGEYEWPGNIRELENCIERAAILVEEGQIRPSHLTIPQSCQIRDELNGAESKLRIKENTIHIDFECAREEFSLDAVIEHTLRVVLKMCDNNASEAAKMLDIGRQMFYRRGIISRHRD